MIFYFSGTGNSQLAARQLAAELHDEVVSINDCLKSGEKMKFHSERPLAVAAPNYAWRLPKVVEQWLRQTEFTGNKKIYFILTCGSHTGANAAFYAKKLCSETGLIYQGLAAVQMPKNNLALYGALGSGECKAIINRAKPIFSSLAGQIANGEAFHEAPVPFGGRFLSGPFHALYYRFYIKDKGFKVSDVCISCGKCAKRCPLNNIDLVNGKPVWKGNCTHCMACICSCPTEAIEYKSISKGKRRYDIMQ